MFKSEQLKLLGLEDTIRESSIFMMDGVKYFAENKDFMKMAVIDRKIVGYDKYGRIYEKCLRMFDTPKVNIKEIREASFVMEKVTKSIEVITKVINSYDMDYAHNYDLDEHNYLLNNFPNWKDHVIKEPPKEPELTDKEKQVQLLDNVLNALAEKIMSSRHCEDAEYESDTIPPAEVGWVTPTSENDSEVSVNGDPTSKDQDSPASEANPEPPLSREDFLNLTDELNNPKDDDTPPHAT